MPKGIVINFLPPAEQAEWVRRAEAAGFDEVWHEGGLIHAAAVVLASQRAAVGTGVLTVYNYEPAIVASAARLLQGLAGGRFRLGIGATTLPDAALQFPRERSHGAERMAEWIALMRRYFAGPPGPFRGRFFSLDILGSQPAIAIPIYVGALTPRMMRMAGRVADGVAGHPFWPAHWAREVILPAVEAGAREAGRPRPPVSGWIFTAIGPDRQTCRDDVRRYYARAIQGEPAKLDAIARRMGWEQAFAAVRAALAAGTTDAALAALPDTLLDALAITGPPDEARRQFAERWDGLYDVPVFYTPGGPRVNDYLAAVIETFGR
ncbi:MAG: LLM class flavin-dependent oxidoreductase [Chloroflexota bacterium]|nr:LLM class flavin-dependent oxidoreductase [Dehalococcoidia bacterium]MDW8253430.1 LLM class flavin-dependent oxidoreductase [Chloroflexota bacterium]